MTRTWYVICTAGLLFLVVACSDDGDGAGTGRTPTATPTFAPESPGSGSEPASTDRFPDIVDATLEPEDGGTWTLAVTVSSPYDTPERYADGWRVLSPGGEELGVHELAHDHAGEQPFTRTQTGLDIPGGVDQIVVEGRDLQNGYGGKTKQVDIPTG